MFSERYKGLGDEVCSGWDCDTLEWIAVLVTSFKAAVDVSSPSSSSTSSTESSRQASSFLVCLLCLVHRSLKKAMSSFCAHTPCLLYRITADFLSPVAYRFHCGTVGGLLHLRVTLLGPAEQVDYFHFTASRIKFHNNDPSNHNVLCVPNNVFNVNTISLACIF